METITKKHEKLGCDIVSFSESQQPKADHRPPQIIELDSQIEKFNATIDRLETHVNSVAIQSHQVKSPSRFGYLYAALYGAIWLFMLAMLFIGYYPGFHFTHYHSPHYHL